MRLGTYKTIRAALLLVVLVPVTLCVCLYIFAWAEVLRGRYPQFGWLALPAILLLWCFFIRHYLAVKQVSPELGRAAFLSSILVVILTLYLSGAVYLLSNLTPLERLIYLPYIKGLTSAVVLLLVVIQITLLNRARALYRSQK